MPRRRCIELLVFLVSRVGFQWATWSADASKKRPNVLMIVVDDLNDRKVAGRNGIG
jgi:hypothetical protein